MAGCDNRKVAQNRTSVKRDFGPPFSNLFQAQDCKEPQYIGGGPHLIKLARSCHCPHLGRRLPDCRYALDILNFLQPKKPRYHIGSADLRKIPSTPKSIQGIILKNWKLRIENDNIRLTWKRSFRRLGAADGYLDHQSPFQGKNSSKRSFFYRKALQGLSHPHAPFLSAYTQKRL